MDERGPSPFLHLLLLPSSRGWIGLWVRTGRRSRLFSMAGVDYWRVGLCSCLVVVFLVLGVRLVFVSELLGHFLRLSFFWRTWCWLLLCCKRPCHPLWLAPQAQQMPDFETEIKLGHHSDVFPLHIKSFSLWKMPGKYQQISVDLFLFITFFGSLQYFVRAFDITNPTVAWITFFIGAAIILPQFFNKEIGCPFSFKSRSSPSQVANYPTSSHGVPITVISDTPTCINKIKELRKGKPTVIGLDCEWKPYFNPKEKNPVGIVQIAN